MSKFWFSIHEATKNVILFIFIYLFLAYEVSGNLKWFSVLLLPHSAVILEITHALVGDMLRFLNSVPIFILYFLEPLTNQGNTFYQTLYTYTSDS